MILWLVSSLHIWHHYRNSCSVPSPNNCAQIRFRRASLSAVVWIAYHVLAKPSRGLAASKAGRGIGHAIGGADGIPMLERARATGVTLRDQSILLVWNLWSAVTNTTLRPLQFPDKCKTQSIFGKISDIVTPDKTQSVQQLANYHIAGNIVQAYYKKHKERQQWPFSPHQEHLSWTSSL